MTRIEITINVVGLINSIAALALSYGARRRVLEHELEVKRRFRELARLVDAL